ncbi:MAG TPA: NFACT family protein, partial [Armatimonadota bacterium]|nr:NFACT family protein [Armatimonadota bacterium]
MSGVRETRDLPSYNGPTAMVFDSAVTACCVAEIAHALVGGRVVSVRQPRRLEVALEVESAQGSSWLIASAEAQYARVHLGRAPAQRDPAQFPFGIFAAKHLRGARVLGVRQIGFDRVVRIDFEPRNRRLVDPVRALVVEVMGKHSNLILLNNVDMVLEAAKHITADMSRVRTVQPHDAYAAPPARGTLDPRVAGAGEFIRLLEAPGSVDQPVEGVLLASLQGANRVLVREALHRVSIGPGESAASLGSHRVAGLAAALVEVFSPVAAGAFRPVRWIEPAAGLPELYPFALDQVPGPAEPVESLGLALDRAVSRVRRQGELEAERGRLLALIAKARAAAERRREKLAAARVPEHELDRLRHAGESILAALPIIPPGARQVQVPDLYSPTGESMTVELDPAKTPQANAEVYFRRYRSARSQAEKLPALVAQVEAELVELGDLEARVRGADERRISGAAAEVEGHRLLQPYAQRGRSGRPSSGPRFLSCSSRDGFELLVGRGASESDELL